MELLRAGLRSGQRQMADWQGGPLGVSAVPGAGKSYGMAVAAAGAIARYQLHSRRQLVVVTFTRSAAASIKSKIREHLKQLSLPPGGFVVHTLHGLALSIALRHPELSQLDLESSTLILPAPSNRIVRACVEKWISEHPKLYQRLIEGVQFDGEETERLRRQSVLRTEVLPNLSWKAIQQAKSSGLMPEDLWKLSEDSADEYQVLAIGAGLYENYQQMLLDRNLIDYDEMILAALRVLENPTTRELWQNQVFAVFEDEAQDSTPLQSRLLEILAARPGEFVDEGSFFTEDKTASGAVNSQKRLAKLKSLNLMRVGDPNQAINSTFTPADPIEFRRFCQECEELGSLATMDRAGRSSQIIMDAANFVLKWVNNSGLAGEEKPFREQEILAVDARDVADATLGERLPETINNPPPTGEGLEIYQPRDIYQTVELIAKRVVELYREEPERTFAVLVRENKQGRFVADTLTNLMYGVDVDLSKYGIEICDVSQGARQSQIPVEMLALLLFIHRPHSPDYLKGALKVLGDRRSIPLQDYNNLAAQPEQFLYPGPLALYQSEKVRKCRNFCRSLLQAKLELPLDRLISFLALALKYDRSDLATADKLGERVAKQTGGGGSLSEILVVLSEIVGSERFEAVEVEADGEKSFTREGQLTIITMHKAKGLDWDYVFLPFLHEGTIPGSLRVLPQGQFLGEFDLAEVARAQIRASLQGRFDRLEEKMLQDSDRAWEAAGYLKTAEEFRLLYVAMTRAKRLLWMSAAQMGPFNWNKPENLQVLKPCPVLPALMERFYN
ncbi:MAG: ATP-dependent helicase [Cyanobacteriota bacterium]|nr:ATP-dependent helicase [Cyanobacteriota bacterium]